MNTPCHRCSIPIEKNEDAIEISWERARMHPADHPRFLRFHIKCFSVIAGDEFLQALGVYDQARSYDTFEKADEAFDKAFKKNMIEKMRKERLEKLADMLMNVEKDEIDDIVGTKKDDK